MRAKDQQQAATAAKNTARNDLEKYIRMISRIIQSNPDVTAGILESMGLPVRDKVRSIVNPEQPADLVVHASPDLDKPEPKRTHRKDAKSQSSKIQIQMFC
ncbi:MAG TPA: hypothetical protein ENL20_12100 [Candidatus Cloacimonetes bacterium]|nr:hypothetical protein [Candidatus Cloacimonadota bacterium]